MPKSPVCTGCKLENCGQDFVNIEGLGRFGIMLVGDYSRETEARESLPLRPHSRGGMIFERTLRRMGFSREQFWVSQALRCKPWDPVEGLGGLEAEVIDYCRPHLIADLKRLKPKVLVALGNVALRTLTGWNGKKRGVHHVRGYVLRALPELCEAAGNPDLCVVPTYHPDHIRNGNVHLIGVFARDIARAVNIRAGKDTSFILDLPPMPREGDVADSLDQENMRAWLKEHNFNYTLHPTIEQVDAFCRDVKQRSDAWLALSPSERDHSPIALSHDIETFESADLDEDESDGFSDTKLSLSQFTIEPGQAIAMPWREPFIQATRWLLKLPLPKVGQNYWYFDRRVLKAVGKRDFMHANDLLSNGPLYDTLQQFHYMEPDLPAHLQFAASYVQFPVIWKHLSGENLEAYGCFDTDSALRIFLMTRRTMQDRGIWSDPVPGRNSTGYLNMVQVVRPILEKMENRGLPINNERRLQLGAEFEKVRDEIYLELDRRFPEAARKLTPKDKGVVTGYANMPPAVKAILEEISPTVVPRFTYVGLPGVLNKKTGELGKPRTEIRDAADQKVTKKFAEDSIKNCFKARWDGVTDDEMLIIRATPFYEPSDEIDEDTGEKIPGDKFYYDRKLIGRQIVNGELSPGRMAWVRVYQFSPNSGAQLMAYMTEKGHEIPYDKKKKKNSTGKKGLERLAVKSGDDFYTKTITCREMDKMGATYVEGFKPNNETGRVHTTFTFSTATGQLSSRAPNTQNYPSHGKLGKAVKSMIEAPEGWEIANWDFKSFHVLMTGLLAEDGNYMRMARLDMHSFVTWNFLKLPDAERLLEFSDAELLEKFKWLKKNEDWKRIRDKQAKPCIAEGELVLTDRGLVPIQNVTLDHRVWDGVEWVSHGGLIDKGIKEVITYAGLTATPDHVVFTEDGRAMAFGEAASCLVRLERTGIAGQAVRTRHSDFLEHSARERVYKAACAMYEVRKTEVDRQVLPDQRRDVGMPVVQSNQVTASRCAGETLRRDSCALLCADEQVLLGLRGAGRNLQVRESECICAVGSNESSTPGLQGRGDRSYQQQRALRAGESETIDAQGTTSESSDNGLDSNRLGAGIAGEFPQSIRGELDTQASIEEGDDRRADHSVCTSAISRGEVQELAPASGVARYARVYDLADAGPRKCYTVSQTLVANCILGIALGMQPPTIYEMNLEHFDNLQRAKDFRALIQRLFPKVFRMQNQTAQEAHDKGELRNSFGMLRKFYEVLQPDGKGGWKPGDQYNAAIALRVQSNSHGELREKAKQMEASGAAEEFGLNNTIHDSFQFCYPIEKRTAMVRAIGPILTGPSKVLVHPVLAPQGLTLGCECEVGRNMADKKEIDWEKLL